VKRSVLFVSKPIVPPYHDGTKCLVRDISLRLTRVTPVVMSTAEAPPLPEAVDVRDGVTPTRAPVYRSSGKFAPALTSNLRAALWLLLRSREDLWHFVFAPNPRTSNVARALGRVRRVPVLQTIASPPREFERIDSLLFGDIIVAQSEWTKAEVLRHAKRAWHIEVIPPPVGPIEERSRRARERARQEVDVPTGVPLFVYPGDIELGNGAARVRAAVAEIVRVVPGAVVVFAYRKKTARASEAAVALARDLPRASVRFTDRSEDVLALIAESRAVLFPVDDLWGKVDLPIVLLEAMSLGVPIVAADRGPLAELQGVARVDPDDPGAIAGLARELHERDEFRITLVEAAKRHVRERHAASVVARRYEQLYLDLLGDET
jgi:glycosyltransferase involved in cell wall biosynthesis